ncbi:uncharacterized protein LOC127782122 [Oryza glaberrima]|uniref:uncharacterized protein LOC127782122 n=1 Tax=Oryza glaberrima TaxID=4538 RepID=UPI00224BFC53|nr:uncharacterized protein LOC127782122 [Oryza glaberrima]
MLGGICVLLVGVVDQGKLYGGRPANVFLLWIYRCLPVGMVLAFAPSFPVGSIVFSADYICHLKESGHNPQYAQLYIYDTTNEYPLLFPYGDAGHHLGIPYKDIDDQDTPVRDRVSIHRYSDRPDMVSRVFHMKLREFIDDIKRGDAFGPVRGVLYTVEFEKRGLPHVHVLVWLEGHGRDPSPSFIDSLRYPKWFNDETRVDESGFPVYRRRNDGRFVSKNGCKIDNKWVVPYNMRLLKKFQAYINVEWYNKTNLVKYLFKCLTKGHDMSRVVFAVGDSTANSGNSDEPDGRDEISNYMRCRYLSSCEAIWRIFGFKIHGRKPSVERTNESHPGSRDLRYCDYPSPWRWDSDGKTWTKRMCKAKIGRIYEDVRSYNGVLYDTFNEACQARGLVGDDTKWYRMFDEAIVWATPFLLRHLFITVVGFCGVGNPNLLFGRYWKFLADDILNRTRNLLDNPSYHVADHYLQVQFLNELSVLFFKNGLMLEAYNLSLGPIPTHHNYENQLISEELSYDRAFLIKEVAALYHNLNGDHLAIYDQIISSSSTPGDIVLAVASSGVASLLLPAGCTTHSRFKIPLEVSEKGLYSISRGTMLAALVARAWLILWDEALMSHRNCFESLGRTLKDILSVDDPTNGYLPFGGKLVVLGGDFRQVLPVVEGGTKREVLNASLIKLPLWQHAIVLKLWTNMRLVTRHCLMSIECC